MIIGLHASILGILFLALSYRVIQARHKYKVSLGDGGNDDLLRRIRTHGNFVEVVPIALILITLSEVQGMAPAGIHTLGALLIVSRLLHAYGLSGPAAPFWARAGGMVMAHAAIIASVVYLLWAYFTKIVLT